MSAEPLLGPLRLGDWMQALDWIIIGGESGNGARPFDIGWARELIAEARAAGVAVFVKQLGKKPQDGLIQMSLESAKGGDWERWSEDLLPPMADLVGPS